MEGGCRGGAIGAAGVTAARLLGVGDTQNPILTSGK